MEREAVLAWLEEHTQTMDGRDVGKRIFLAPPGKRLKTADRGLDAVRDFLQLAQQAGEEVLEKHAVDGIFLATHIYAARADAWLGAESWPSAIIAEANVPAMGPEEVERALLRDVDHAIVAPSEVRTVVDAFVEATWGETVSREVAEAKGFDAVVISTLPQMGAMQYCIGVLWGYALRGLVLRLALDRSLGTLPETAAAARRRLERSLALPEDGAVADAAQAEAGGPAKPRAPTLMEYANDFFGHKEWAALCKPVDAALVVLETELEEMLPGLAMLAGAADSDLIVGEGVDAVSLVGMDSDDDDDDDDDEDDEGQETVYLPQEDWQGFQRRAVAFGALLADAEAFVDAEVGPLVRGRRRNSKWAGHLVASGVLSSVRREHGSMLASRIAAPLKRVADALRTNLLPSKLSDARKGLERLLSKDEG